MHSALFRFQLFFVIFFVFPAIFCGADVMEVEDAGVWEYIRSGSPTQAILHAFDIHNKKMTDWLLDERYKELLIPENIKFLQKSPEDFKHIENDMWNRQSKSARLTLMCRQVVYQDFSIYRKLWDRLCKQVMRDNGLMQLSESFQYIAPEFRGLFIKNMVNRALFIQDRDKQEKIIQDFTWFCSKGIANDLPPKDMCKILGDMRKSRTYAKQGYSCDEEGCSVRKRRRLEHRHREFTCTCLTALYDPDKFFENICFRYFNTSDLTALAFFCMRKPQTLDKKDYETVYSCFGYAERWRDIQKIIKNSAYMKKMGPDVLALQKSFCYPSEG